MKYTSLKTDAQLLFMDKTNELVSEIQSFLSDLSIVPNSIVKVECYVPVNNQDEFSTCLAAFNSTLTSVFKEKQPARLLVAQSLADDSQAALLKFSICDDKACAIEFKAFQKHHYCVVTSNEERLIISGGISFESITDTLRQVQSTFDFMEQLLDHEEMHFGHVAYQANFISDIQGTKKEATTGWTNVQIIDEIRALYFDPTLMKHGQPLQNITNCNTKGFTMDFIAASKDGFPTGQYNLNEEGEQTQNCYIPGLKKLFVKPPVSSHKPTCEAQLQDAVDTLNACINNCGKEIATAFDELRIIVSSKDNLELVKSIISAQVNTNKLVLIHAPLLSNDLKIEVEAIASVMS